MTALTKTGLAIGLTTGALALGLGGAGLLVSQLPARANAGIVSTLPVANSSSRGLVTTALTANPDSGEALVDAGTTRDQPAEEDKGAARPQRPVIGAEGNGASGLTGKSDPGAGGPANAVSPTANAPAAWDFKPRSLLVERIEQTLSKGTEFVFRDTSLEEALCYVKDLNSIEIILDKEALSTDGIATDSPINLVINGISLSSALNLLLEPLQLDYVIKNEVLVITTRVKADEMFETRVYNVARIPHLTPKELVEIIIGGSGGALSGGAGVGVASEGAAGDAGRASGGSSLPAGPSNSSLIGAQWVEVNREGGTAWAGKTTLIIRQTQRVHREIVELLDQLAQKEAAPTKTPINLDGRSGGLNTVPKPPAGSPFGSGAGAAGTGFSPASKGPPASGGSATKPGGR